MPKQKRHKTRYPGVYWIQGQAIGGKRPERVYYITYRKNAKLIEEKAVRQYKDDMTPARAAQIRTRRIQGSHRIKKKELLNRLVKRLRPESGLSTDFGKSTNVKNLILKE